MLGGGMRQVGLLCAAARVAVDTMVDRLAEDHEHAQRLARGVADALPGSVDPATVETNMVYIETAAVEPDTIVRAMADDGVAWRRFGPTESARSPARRSTAPGSTGRSPSFARAVSGGAAVGCRRALAPG